MKNWNITFKVICLIFFTLALVISSHAATIDIKHLGDGHSMVKINCSSRFLLLPVEESSPESRIEIVVDNKQIQTINIRLANRHVDYMVPLEIGEYKGVEFLLNVHSASASAICWREIRVADSFDVTHKEKYRPLYHFSPAWGWMNDPNGMVYKDGEYHLFYQHNPYGSMWGNMHWGHAISRNLVNWEHLPDAIAPDALGTIFSGSCVVDKDNTSGFGAGAIVAFYTSAGERQTQSMAYSIDNGRTFKKYDRNPILTSNERDFRDPKVFWHEKSSRWIMVLAVGQVIQFYSSPNLKDWRYESSFGSGQGAHSGVWECPDLIELQVKGSSQKKWVLICNINPGGPSGGSATQYFVGSFNGKEFVNESPELTKWMDFGKDHYATVTWSGVPNGRKIALAWMSNWDYANNVPTLRFRSANSVPRDLSLFMRNGETYLASNPSPELLYLRGKEKKIAPFKVSSSHDITELLTENNGGYEIVIKFKNNGADKMGVKLLNSKGNEVELCYNLMDKNFTMDRRSSGVVDFSYKFIAATTAPISSSREYTLRLFVDKCSIEAFDGNGEFAMTNLIFPEEPYNSINFRAEGGSYTVTSMLIYPLQ